MMYLRYDAHVRELARAAMPSYKALNLSGDISTRRGERPQKVEGTGSHRASNDLSPLNTLPMADLGGFTPPHAPTPAGASKPPASAPSAAADAPANPFDETCIEDGCNQPHNGSWTDRCDEHAAEYFAFDFDGIDL